MQLRHLDDPRITLPQLLAGSEQVVQRLRDISAGAGPLIKSSIFYTRLRAKTAESIEGKIANRRRDPKTPDYSFRNLTDYAGFRIITLSDNDLISAIDFVLKIIKAGQYIPDPVFEPGITFEAFHDATFNARTERDYDGKKPVSQQNDIYYRCMRHLLDAVDDDISELDPQQALSVRNYITAHCQPKTKSQNRYSSAHLTFWAISYHSPTLTIPIPVEFQIRTAIEDVWAEVSHKLLYKSRSEYVWSAQYESSLERAEQTLLTVKSQMDNLPEQIAGIYKSAAEAKDIADNFWGDKKQASKNERPADTELHFSLCASLIALAGDGKLPTEVKGPLVRYGRRLNTISPGHSNERAAAILGKCISSLTILSAEIRSLHLEGEQQNEKGEYVEPLARLYEQRQQLVELEILRLRAVMAINYGHKFENIPTQFDPAGEDRDIVLMEIYSNFCSFSESTRLKLKPITMLHFWKYLLAYDFGNPEMARINLHLSYTSMHADPTLPSWSIYKVLVPSFLGQERFTEAMEVLADMPAPDIDPRRMPRVSAVLKEKLTSCIRFATDAFDEHVDRGGLRGKRRGDILFDDTFTRPITQAQMAVHVTRLLNDRFGAFIAKNSPSIRPRLRRIVDYIENNRNEFDFLENEDKDSLDSDVAVVKTLLADIGY
jgi:ppGpp synthetase/RelA/SpoT-type nucleotidyltranferase